MKKFIKAIVAMLLLVDFDNAENYLYALEAAQEGE